mmetsp:Transcript_27655/g.69988  ORF Transcript_27655/g.69988 Transcript_27655/m.69988 type:complete len:213 (-) Transcript_27655:43-681(-)
MAQDEAAKQEASERERPAKKHQPSVFCQEYMDDTETRRLLQSLMLHYGALAAGIVWETEPGLPCLVVEGIAMAAAQSSHMLHDDLRRCIPTIIEDASRSQRHKNDPLLAGLHKVRLCVRAPLLGGEKQRIGSLFLLGRTPGSFSLNECEVLMAAAASITDRVVAGERFVMPSALVEDEDVRCFLEGSSHSSETTKSSSASSSSARSEACPPV